jgi:hypothetical protein
MRQAKKKLKENGSTTQESTNNYSSTQEPTPNHATFAINQAENDMITTQILRTTIQDTKQETNKTTTTMPSPSPAKGQAQALHIHFCGESPIPIERHKVWVNFEKCRIEQKSRLAV